MKRSASPAANWASASASIAASSASANLGRSHRDLTAIGTVVNTASRAQSAAAGGEILLTKAIYERVPSELQDCRAQDYRLKGLDSPVALYAA